MSESMQQSTSRREFLQAGGGLYVTFLLALLVGSFLNVVIYRLPLLQGRHELDSWVSKEAAFLANNWVLLFSALFVLFAAHHSLFARARAKRRVGLGFTGLGDALIMLRLHYDSNAARSMAARIAEAMRDRAYAASVELARERGAFPLFNADLYLSRGTFASRLPAASLALPSLTITCTAASASDVLRSASSASRNALRASFSMRPRAACGAWMSCITA